MPAWFGCVIFVSAKNTESNWTHHTEYGFVFLLWFVDDDEDFALRTKRFK